MDDQAAFCVKCGVAKGMGNNYCQNCGRPVNPGAVACTMCGAPCTPPVNSRAVIQIILTVVTCGLAWLWGFIEGIMILCGNINTDANGVPLGE